MFQVDVINRAGAGGELTGPDGVYLSMLGEGGGVNGRRGDACIVTATQRHCFLLFFRVLLLRVRIFNFSQYI